EPAERPIPITEQSRRYWAAGVARMLDQQVADQLDIVRFGHRLELDHPQVATLGEVPLLVEDEGHAAAHAGGEVAARRPDHEGDASGHVLAAVVARALDDRLRAAVSDAEPL